MTSCSNLEIRRCRPLLGTFVEITLSAKNESRLHQAANGAFAAIEEVHRLMSAHDPASELSLLNREALKRPVRVSPQTFEVLKRARQISDESCGAFDCTVAPTLARWGLLPSSLKRKEAGRWHEVQLSPGRKVRYLRPLSIDLGGIAKGFAVDRAVEVLRNSGATAGLVNAGGDLRAFGPQIVKLHLRHPATPNVFARSINLHESALATSSPCFTEHSWRGKPISHLVNPRTNQSVSGAISVSVRAKECWLADALTKVVLNASDAADRLLQKHQAEAIILTA